jgi:hypothetical protein
LADKTDWTWEFNGGVVEQAPATTRRWRFLSVTLKALNDNTTQSHGFTLPMSSSFSTDAPPDEKPLHPIQSPNRAQPHHFFFALI